MFNWLFLATGGVGRTGDWIRIEEGEENQGVGGCLPPSLPSLGPLPAFEGQPLELFRVSGVTRDLGPCVCPLQPVSGIPQLGWKGSLKPAPAAKALRLCPSVFSVEPGIPAWGRGCWRTLWFGCYGYESSREGLGSPPASEPHLWHFLYLSLRLYCLFLWGRRENEYSEDPMCRKKTKR